MHEEDWLQRARQRRKQDEQKSSAGSDGGWLERARQRRFEEDVQKVDSGYVDMFLGAANDYFSSAQSDFETLNWGNAGSAYSNRESTKKDLDYRQNVIRTWLDRQRGNLGEDAYKGISAALDSYTQGSTSILDSFKGPERMRINEYYY